MHLVDSIIMHQNRASVSAGRRCLLVQLLALVTSAALVGAGATPTNSSVYGLRKRLNWCGPKHERDPLVGLDDRLCQKQFPPLFDRGFACPTLFDHDPAFVRPGPDGFNVSTLDVDEAELVEAGVLAPNVTVAVGVVKRYAGGTYGVRWLGQHSRRAQETWSSSKVFAGSSAGRSLRGLDGSSDPQIPCCGSGAATTTAPPSRRLPGLSAVEHGELPASLADLMTVVTSYDTTSNLTSNGIGAYYQSLGGHRAADHFVHGTLGAAAAESFGGGYGEPAPARLGYSFSAGPSGSSRRVEHPPDPVPYPPLSNTLSALTMAEWLRRVVFAREDADAGGDAGAFAWEDSADVLYGANASTLFPGLQWGGMSMSSDIYLQLAAGNVTRVDADAKGLWRIFSKLGFGFTTIRHRYETQLNAYGCFPVHATGRGLEFVVSAQVYDTGHDDGQGADLKMRQATASLVAYLRRKYGQ